MELETETAGLTIIPRTIRAGTRCLVPAREGLSREDGRQGQIASAATLAAGTRTTPLCAARFAFEARLRKSTGLGLRAAGGWLAGTTKRGLGLPTSPSFWFTAGACAAGSWFAGAGQERSGQSFATLWQRGPGAAEAGTARVGSAGTGTTFRGTLILRPFGSGAIWTATVRPGPIELRPIKARTARFGAVEFGPICRRASWNRARGGPIRLDCVDLKARLLGDRVVGLRECLAPWWDPRFKFRTITAWRRRRAVQRRAASGGWLVPCRFAGRMRAKRAARICLFLPVRARWRTTGWSRGTVILFPGGTGRRTVGGMAEWTLRWATGTEFGRTFSRHRTAGRAAACGAARRTAVRWTEFFAQRAGGTKRSVFSKGRPGERLRAAYGRRTGFRGDCRAWGTAGTRRQRGQLRVQGVAAAELLGLGGAQFALGCATQRD